MSTRSERARLPRALIGFGAVLALALVAMLALTLHGPSAAGAQAQAATAALPVRVAPPSELDLLRVDATIGDHDAGRLLVGQLLDRYERAGDTDDLYEAVQWMDRDWRAGTTSSPAWRRASSSGTATTRCCAGTGSATAGNDDTGDRDANRVAMDWRDRPAVPRREASLIRTGTGRLELQGRLVKLVA